MFVTTHWSVVLSAGHQQTEVSQSALSELCRVYWYPLYAYVRRKGYSPEDAQDLTQEFFARLLELKWVNAADPERGRFRTFLLTALNRFLNNEWDRLHAQKRGAGVKVIPLEGRGAELRYHRTGIAGSPDHVYDREWAIAVLDRAMQELEREHQERQSLFQVLTPWITADRGSVPYPEIAVQLGISEEASRQALHRMRKRFGQLLRLEVARTVGTKAEAEEETRYLIAALA